MQIHEKNGGVTLVVLVITIIVLLILAGITLNFGLSTIYEVTDDRTGTELAMVEQALVQQYTLLITQNQDDRIATEISENVLLEDDTDRPEILIGTRIADVSTLNSYGFAKYIVDYINTSDMTYEEYYYLLDQSDLEALGVKYNSEEDQETQERSYIVNYSTGEDFDIVNKIYETTEDPIYLEGTDSNSKIDTETYNFTDE